MFRAITQLMVLCIGLLTLSACNLGTPQATPVVTPDIPTVEILAPANNQQVFVGTDFDIDILGTDTTQGIARIALYLDGALLNESSVPNGTQPQYRVTMNWLAQGEGFHVLSAIAYREDGTSSDEAIINLEVITRD